MEHIRIRLACSLFDRLLGLLRKDRGAQGEILALIPCKSIHTFGMKEDIDIAFVNSDAQVLVAKTHVQPGKLYSCRGAVGTLERRSTEACPWFEVGDSINLLVNVAESCKQ